MSVATAAVDAPVRKVALRTRGDSIGRIKSALLMQPTATRQPPFAPSELAEMLKPFILLDAFDMDHAVLAVKHPYSLSIYGESVHTSPEALEKGRRASRKSRRS